jgi:predicted aspartyl protease
MAMVRTRGWRASVAVFGLLAVTAACTTTESTRQSTIPTSASIDSTAPGSTVSSIGISAPGTASAIPSSSASSAGASTASSSSRSSASSVSSAAPSSGGPVVLKPVTLAAGVEKNTDGSTVVLVPVTVSGRTFLFIVDTGAASTVVDSAVVSAVGLPSVGKPLTTSGVGCSAAAQPVRITSWSIGGEALPVETAPSTKTQFSGKTINGTQFGGLLGADVAKAFGLITVDYDHSSVTFGGQAPAGKHTVPVTVESKFGETLVLVRATLHGLPSTMAVDTGASLSLVSEQLAESAHLQTKGEQKKISAVSCQVSEQPVLLDQLVIGDLTLPAVTATSTSASQPGGFGLLGSDILSTFGTMTIDYNHQKLILGRP